MLSCVGASCLEEKSHTTETHAKQKALGWHYVVGIMPSPAFTLQSSVPTFYKCPIWQRRAQQCLLRFWFKHPLQMWTWSKSLNDPNDAFQIVSSHIAFRGKPWIMFYQLDWQQMEKNWKVICTVSFYFIVAHYGGFRWLISASSCV